MCRAFFTAQAQRPVRLRFLAHGLPPCPLSLPIEDPYLFILFTSCIGRGTGGEGRLQPREVGWIPCVELCARAGPSWRPCYERM